MKLETLDYLIDALDQGKQRIGDAVLHSSELVERQLRPLVDGVSNYFPNIQRSPDTYHSDQEDAWRNMEYTERPSLRDHPILYD